jgi:hypothetical protein
MRLVARNPCSGATRVSGRVSPCYSSCGTSAARDRGTYDIRRDIHRGVQRLLTALGGPVPARFGAACSPDCRARTRDAEHADEQADLDATRWRQAGWHRYRQPRGLGEGLVATQAWTAAPGIPRRRPRSVHRYLSESVRQARRCGSRPPRPSSIFVLFGVLTLVGLIQMN